MFILKNRNDPQLIEANLHTRLGHSKQLLKNIHPIMLASFCSQKDIYSGHTEKLAELECGPMPKLMVALPNIGGALCSTPQSLPDAHY